jgi:flagellar biosynthesis/type III secretory pathway M-ring protein FliF/YscJ
MPIVGEGNVRAEATADVDFAQIEQAAETYKPNSPPAASAIRSQQSSETSGSAGSKIRTAFRARCPTSRPAWPRPPDGGRRRRATGRRADGADATRNRPPTTKSTRPCAMNSAAWAACAA